MRKITAGLSITALLLAVAVPIHAQTRGEGVGALFTNTQGDTTISIVNVRTAPWSEVIVENGAGETQAVAKLDEKGLVNFTFEAESTDVGNLYIYAVDKAGVTNKILITGTSLRDEVLPPTIISEEEEELPEDSIELVGFGYPGVIVSVVLDSGRGYHQNFSAETNTTSGSWEISIDLLVSGNYTAKATAGVAEKISQESQVLVFEIPSEGIIEDLIKLAGVLATALTQLVQELPEPVKRAADATSKAALPLALLGIMLQSGLATLGDLLALSRRYLFTLARIPLFPLLLKRRKKKRPWGVLYDSSTKHPLSGGLVRLLGEAGNFIDGEVTGKSGAFSFIPTPGKYQLEALKEGYTFPSQNVAGGKDGEYDHLYRGEMIEILEDQPIVESSVPLDPREFVKGAQIQRLFRRHGPVVNLLILIGGLVLSGIAYLAAPAIYNQLIAGFYLVTLSLVTADTVRIERTWGFVKDEIGNPVEAIALSLIEIESKRLVKRRVTNEQGRYQFVAPRGRYKILIASFDWERIDQNGCYDGSEVAVVGETETLSLPIAVKKKPITALKRRETI
jgi:hypothetical protein